ncbi:bifunctional phosphoribosyl-AMP cyclohydrolase/phosphoribosyl-ATP diphosphatase HisIE [Myxococcota bacterium]|nr:bifunctional phosphoribosyl-AMP cyclohydrolase/phosphoribosyl-ATP diphosphatase HisIE [Myxococcota bacterium]
MTTERDIELLWQKTHPDEKGLVPCVVQDLRTRAVLMVAWVSKEALERSLESGYATYWSRSRQQLWEKGATSGNRQRLIHVRLDCDGDTLLYLVEAKLPACHEGTDTCFSRRRVGGGWRREPIELEARGEEILGDLEDVIDARANAPSGAPPSYTRTLLDAGPAKQIAKIREESEELAVALTQETDERVASEAADVLYHLAVALRGRGMSFQPVFAELQRRFGRSGIDEKASRGASTRKGG